MTEQRVHYLHDRLRRPRTSDQSLLAIHRMYRFLPNAVTYAYIIEEGDKDTLAVVSVACAVCSPDDQFCRKAGREVAHDRLTKGRSDLFVSVRLQTGMRVPTTAYEWRAFDKHVIELFLKDQERLNPVLEDIPW